MKLLEITPLVKRIERNQILMVAEIMSKRMNTIEHVIEEMKGRTQRNGPIAKQIEIKTDSKIGREYLKSQLQ